MQIVIEGVAPALAFLIVKLAIILEIVNPIDRVSLVKHGVFQCVSQCSHVASVIFPFMELINTNVLHRCARLKLGIFDRAFHKVAVHGIFRTHIVNTVFGIVGYFVHDKFTV